jgi:hypothetical protein
MAIDSDANIADFLLHAISPYSRMDS